MARVSLLTALAVAAACQYVSAGTTFKQAAQASQPKKILHFSDVHLRLSESLDATESANIPIQYGQDAPIALLTSALQFAKTVLPDPDLFLYTGDHVVHGDLEDEFIAATVETNVKTLEEYYPPGNTTLDTTAIIGNADTPGDYRMEVTDGTKENPAIALIADAWSNSLSAADLETFKRQGFLSYNLDDNLVVLSLNTLPYSPNHLPNTADQPDPFGQFAWLNSTLRTIKQQKKVAYIVGHIPPMVDSYRGTPLWHPSYIATYKQIVGQFASVVKAQLFAHVHSVEVRVPVKGAGGFDSVPLFTTAAISPLYKNNPAFVVWDFHPTTYDLLDFTVYGSNITDSSAVEGWKQLFKATEAFKVKSLSTSEFRKFVNRATADSALLQQYYNNAKALSYKWPTCADTACRAKWRCSLSWWSTAAEYEDCVAAEEDPKTVAAATTLSANSSESSGWESSQALIAVGAVAVAAIAVVVVVGRRHRKKKQQRQQQRQHHASATTPDSGSSADSFLVLAQTPL